MLQVFDLNANTLDKLRPLYAQFEAVAQSHYGWPATALEFPFLSHVITMGALKGYVVEDVAEKKPVAFLLYNIEPYRALEIKVIYMTDDAPVKIALDVLMNRFIQDIKVLPNWDVVSYPILGEGQLRYIDFMTWYGMKPVGQSVTSFHLFNSIGVEVFKRAEFPPLPEGYRFATYEPQYQEGVIDVLTQAFEHSVDALWDPRFRTRHGVAEAFHFVQNGGYGVFYPNCTTVMLNAQDKVVGVCLFNIVGKHEANIPLIGIALSERKHKLGRTLLAETVRRCIFEVIESKLDIAKITATVATENIPAVKMYRYTGFQEDNWYPHVYQNKDDVLKKKAGQWC